MTTPLDEETLGKWLGDAIHAAGRAGGYGMGAEEGRRLRDVIRELFAARQRIYLLELVAKDVALLDGYGEGDKGASFKRIARAARIVLAPDEPPGPAQPNVLSPTLKSAPHVTSRTGKCACCPRGDEYNGYGSDGPTKFTCPKRCACHD